MSQHSNPAAVRLIGSSCEDLRASLANTQTIDIGLLMDAMVLAVQKDEKTKAKLISTRLKQLTGQAQKPQTRMMLLPITPDVILSAFVKLAKELVGESYDITLEYQPRLEGMQCTMVLFRGAKAVENDPRKILGRRHCRSFYGKTFEEAATALHAAIQKAAEAEGGGDA